VKAFILKPYSRLCMASYDISYLKCINQLERENPCELYEKISL